MRIACSDAYRLWAPSYDSGPNPLLALEMRLISDVLGDRPSRTLVDIGCGTGRSMSRYAKHCRRVFGADTSIEMLAEAQRKTGLRGALALADASALPFAGSIADVTLCSFSLSYFSDVSTAFREMARITRLAGLVIISDLHPAAIAKGWTRSFRANGAVYEIDHVSYDDDELRSLAQNAGLQTILQIEAPFSEYERHHFSAAGKEHLFDESSSIPAVRIGICSKL